MGIVEWTAAGPIEGDQRATAIARERYFVAGSGRLTLGVAGNIRCLLSNPAGSEREMWIERLVVTATVTGWAQVRRSPTTGLPATLRTSHNAVLDGAPATCTMHADTDATTAIGGGTLLSDTPGIPANTRVSIEMPPLVLRPGVTLGFNVPIGGAGDASLSAYWFEEDAV